MPSTSQYSRPDAGAPYSLATFRRTLRLDRLSVLVIRREDADRFIEEARGDEPELASYLRIEERELWAGGTN